MKVTINKIIQEFKYEDLLLKADFEIQGISTLNDIKENTILFVNKYKDEFVERINNMKNMFILLRDEYKDCISYNENVYVFVKNPRFEYARVVDFILSKEEENFKFETINGSFIASSAHIDSSVKIEPGSFIGPNVTIEKGTRILSGAKIKANVKIGKNCIIRENCVIGGYGFGFEKDYEGKNFRIPHIGGVIIGNNVEIGAITTVCSGTINPTIIEDYAKIDDHVHIAHNVVIGENSIVTACAEVSGSCIIGKNAWLAPNTSIINGIKIGENVTIGMGAVVTKPVEDNQIMVGAPAETLEEAKKFKRIKTKMISED
ncbi:UDP-3-O-(3-hydroxymyristoyl)glucosamine N-acyltransferase [Clostridium sp.]|uniref:UDP-3-O-(3-hydroxymyristoyl)glucosamine N-acyltransferase n=1 Tax=Clostridium sp. TaxID=1506 RepID=UPI0025C31DB1|nr:UDP-3-O-(3-hydroxymyristoyl)glucosamine N-acyltransferase [Clostridium sp.]